MVGREKVVIFGASKAGENFINHQEQYNIVAIIDNDKEKEGQYLSNIKIYSPSKLKNLEYKKIIITSMYYKAIKNQLINEFNINPSDIIAANKSMLKEVMSPFEDDQTLNYAKNILKKLVNILNNYNLSFFLDYGTLLGMIRDQNLIRWDDDIDISCSSDEFNKLTEAVNRFIFETSNELPTWKYNLIYNYGKVSNISLTFENELFKPLKFSIDIWLTYFYEDKAFQLMNKCENKYFIGCDKIIVEDFEYPIPKFVDEYLTLLYGDWQKPVKNYTFANYPNAF